MPSCRLKLKGPRPRVLPRGYAREPQTLGQHIRKRRVDLGLRQRDLARRFGVRAEVVATWELGTNQPAAHRYPAIMAFLGYDPVPEPAGLPDRLRAARLSLGLTKKALAALLGLDEGTMIDIERGRRVPRGRIRGILERFVAGREGLIWADRRPEQAALSRSEGSRLQEE